MSYYYDAPCGHFAHAQGVRVGILNYCWAPDLLADANSGSPNKRVLDKFKVTAVVKVHRLRKDEPFLGANSRSMRGRSTHGAACYC